MTALDPDEPAFTSAALLDAFRQGRAIGRVEVERLRACLSVAELDTWDEHIAGLTAEVAQLTAERDANAQALRVASEDANAAIAEAERLRKLAREALRVDVNEVQAMIDALRKITGGEP